MTTIALDSTVVRPGTWLRLKSCAPNRLRHAVSRLERLLYGNRGVFVWLDDKAVRCAVDAAPGFLAHPDHAEDRLLMQQVFESLEPGDTFLDVGSHVGFYAIGAALRVGPGGRVVAFEPTPATVAKMARNVALNHLTDRIAIEEVAVSDAVGTVDFVTTGTSMMNSIFKGVPQGHTRPGGPERSIPVRTARLDQFFDAGRRTVAKIDTEGHEIAVLRGAPALLASPARIFVELHPWAWESQEAAWAELLDLCRRNRREVRRLDGTLLLEPTHCRAEFARI
jgi:FkbM family methyltransferase